MKTTDRVLAVRDIVVRLATRGGLEHEPELQRALDELDHVARDSEAAAAAEQRLQQVAHALYSLASLSFDASCRANILDDGSVLDAVSACVNMLGEELRAHMAVRDKTEAELDLLVRARTLELIKANEQLSVHMEERLRAEQALRKSEEALLQAQKMEAVGRLSGGIAHDFNNLLCVIMGSATLLLDELDATDPARADVQDIMSAGERASALTRQLLLFSRRHVLEMRIVDLEQLCVNMHKMLSRLIGEHIELCTRSETGLGSISIDPHQLEQVIMNLVINASDAMPNGGRVTIETRNVEVVAGAEIHDRGVMPGSYVVLSVTDTGCGMDKSTALRAFEPFFTTKGQGKGTGLGLSIVFGVVQQSGGFIVVDSKLEEGSCFAIYLPRVRGVSVRPRASQAPKDDLRGSATVLLVEDEDAVRKIVSKTLQRYGYRVLEANGAKEALRIHAQHGNAIQLLLTDVIMPGMNGRALADQILSTHSAIKVLYMSGYTDNVAMNSADSSTPIAFLQKPVTPRALAEKLREVLQS